MRLAVFVDYDGTITDVDTFDVLVRHYAGDGVWDELEERLAQGEITLKEAMEKQASFVRGTLDDADALLRANVEIDQSFASFVRICRERGVDVTIVSSGLRQLIERALARQGVEWLPLVAGDVRIDAAQRWTLHYPDVSPNGIDKAAMVESARVDGLRVVYVGDGRSDFDAARAADVRFAKKGKALEHHLAVEGLGFAPFTSFSEVERVLFP